MKQTRIELADKIRNFRNHSRAMDRGVVLWLVLLTLSPAFSYIFVRISGAGHESLWAFFMWLWIIVITTGGLILGNRIAKMARAKLGAFCSECQANLSGIHGQVAVATGFCGACGESIVGESDEARCPLVDPKGLPDETSMLTSSELAARTCHTSMLKREGLTCPQCGDLLSGVNLLLARHTGFGCCCGHRIISDPLPPSPNETSHADRAKHPDDCLTFGKPNRSELATRIRRHEKASARISSRSLVGIFIAAMAGVAFMVAFPKLQDVWYILLCVLLFAGLIGAGMGSDRKLKRLKKDSGLHCPHCSRLLAGRLGSLAVGTLFCNSCGNQVVKDPPQS